MLQSDGAYVSVCILVPLNILLVLLFTCNCCLSCMGHKKFCDLYSGSGLTNAIYVVILKDL